MGNFHRGAGETWRPPAPQITGWHKDGSYFRHFIASRAQALLTISLWSDRLHQGGGTFIAPDSVRIVARHVFQHPEGVDPNDFDFKSIVSQCTHFEEKTGKAGDIVTLHPSRLHASSQNVIGVPRFMSNPPIMLKEPMNLNRENPQDFSL